MRILAALMLALAAVPMPAAQAAELVYVEAKGCVYCARFNGQKLRNYKKSEVGQATPIRRVDLMRRWPKDLNQVDRPPYTPVFILVEDGRELGRFNGYVNPQKFDRDLKRLLSKRG